jgi:hypothetical protein
MPAALTPSRADRHHREHTFQVSRKGEIKRMDTTSTTQMRHTSGQAQGGALPAPHSGTVSGAASGAAGGLLGALLDIAGATDGSLPGMLAAWQREQDRLANRAWRRPGGMARPAGL